MQQGRIVVAEMLKALSATKSSPSTITTTNLVKSQTSQTMIEELSLISPFLKNRRKC